MKKLWQMTLVLLLGTGLVLSGFPAVYGQDDDEDKEVFTLDEIIVTATKREESVLEVPLTVSAFDDQRIEELGMISMDDLNMLAPGLQIGEESDLNDHGWVIRGIGSRLWGEVHSDLAVATYVDGVYQYAPMGMAPSMFDIERIEVARGPQGTLHGRNSIAGSVSFFNKRPTDEWDLDITTEWTNQFSQRYGVAFGGPIFDWLSFRVVGHFLDGQGAQKNIGDGPDLDAPHDQYWAAALRYKTDRIDLNIRHHESLNEGTPRQLVTLGEMSDEDIWRVWDNERSENYNHWYAYTKNDPFPATSGCDQSGLQYSTESGYDPISDEEVPGETKLYYYNGCTDLRNIVNLNGENRSETDLKSTSVHFDFDIFKSLTVRMVYGESKLFHENSREMDGSNRTGGWEGELWFISPWEGTLITNRNLLSKDAGVSFWERWYTTPYKLSQSSGEVVLFSDFDGPLNFIIGAFYYQNDTDYQQRTFIPSEWWRWRQAEEDWPAFMATGWNWGWPAGADGLPGPGPPDDSWNDWWTPNNPQTNIDYPGGPWGSELPDAGPNGEYPPTEAGCNEFIWDVKLVQDYNLLPGDYICVYNEPDHQGTSGYQSAAGTETKAAFAHVGWQFNDQWSISGGARTTEDLKKQHMSQTWNQGMWNSLFVHRWYNVPTRDENARSWDDIIWDVSVEWNFAESMMAYGRIATGYRAGSFQSGQQANIAPLFVESETLINYEIGVKGATLDQRLWFTAGAFYSPYDGFQIDLAQPYPEDLPIPIDSWNPMLEYVGNIDGTKIWGAEIEGTYSFTERFRVSGYYIYMDSSLGPHQSVTRGIPFRMVQREDWYGMWFPIQSREDFPYDGDYKVITHTDAIDPDTGALLDAELLTREESLAMSIEAGLDCILGWPCWGQVQYTLPDDKTGNSLAMQPNHKWSLTASYTMPMPNLGRPSLHLGNLQLLATYSYTGKRHPYIANIDFQHMPGYGEMNLRASWWSETGRWSATLWVANVLDQTGLITYVPGSTRGYYSVATLSNPRKIGLVLRYKM